MFVSVKSYSNSNITKVNSEYKMKMWTYYLKLNALKNKRRQKN